MVGSRFIGRELMVIGWGVGSGIVVQAIIVFVVGLFITLFIVHFQYLTIQLVI
jgi:hypothetical protein